jgi:hypothetical protein
MRRLGSPKSPAASPLATKTGDCPICDSGIRFGFPPPTCEMPNNAFFEVTGMLQVIPGLMTGYYLYQFVRGLQNPHDAGSDT